jgi:hypothetical protein
MYIYLLDFCPSQARLMNKKLNEPCVNDYAHDISAEISDGITKLKTETPQFHIQDLPYPNKCRLRRSLTEHI